MKAIVHIGTDGTRASELQRFLFHNADKLAEQHIHYFCSGGLNSSRELASYCINGDRKDIHVALAALAHGGKRNKWREDFHRRFRKQLETLPTTTQCVLFSSEHFHSQLSTHMEITRLQRELHRYFSEIEIVAYLRPQDQLACARYHECGLRGEFLPSLIEQDSPLWSPFFSYLGLAERWSHVFDGAVPGAVPTLRAWDRGETTAEAVIADFLNIVGVSEQLPFPPAPDEVSLPSAQSLRAMHIINRHFPLAMALREKIFKTLIQRYPGAPAQPSRAEAEAFYDIYRDSNNLLAQRFLGRNRLFEPDFQQYTEQAISPPLSDELVSDLIGEVASHLRNKMAHHAPSK